MQLQEKVINGFRLSPQQKRLWFLQQDSLAYRVQTAILMEGNLQPNILRSALHTVVQRHEILRTSFQRPAGIKTPVQVIADESLFVWQEVDLTNLDRQQQAPKFESLFEAEKLITFDFDRASLLRCSLLSLDDKQNILLLSLPAICADSCSLNNLIQEIGQCYAACVENKNLSDEDIVQYLQFSEWQNQLFEDEDAAAGIEYWQKYDISNLAALILPFENKPLANYPQFKITKLDFNFAADVLEKIDILGQKYNVSTSSFLLACWQILLWRFTEQTETIVGIAADGRKYEELETVIGLLAKYLPLQFNLEGNFSFKEVWQEVNKLTQSACEWQEYFTWEKAESSFLPFCFEFQEQPAKYHAGDVLFSINKQFNCIDRYKLNLSCTRRENSLFASLYYDANLFNLEDIQRLAEHFQVVVNSAIANPESAIDRLPILSDRHLHQILVEFNNTQQDFPKNKCIHQLFEEQTERTPDNISVVFEQQQITYAELNQRANQLAHYLQRLGVRPEVLVGIYLERSVEVIIALLAILKAGGAYLPIDPALPIESLSLRLQDADVPILLTQQQLIKELPVNNTQLVYLDKDWDTIAIESKDNPESDVTPENLVYVIYTSGSTGKPKGVAIEHQQLFNYLHGINEKLNLPTGASFATVSTIAADLGNTVIFPALCTGGCLHIISKEKASDPEALADYFNRHSIDCLKIVPSHLEALLTSSQSKLILPRKRLILGGEAASCNLIEKIQKLAPDCLIFNHYGPTESTVGVLTYQVNAENLTFQSATVPLGRPIANAQIYLLDKYLQPVPIGVKGEVYIGGASLARGYLNRPELTAEKFIHNPFLSNSDLSFLNYELKTQNSKLYKTGDFARYLSDGNIEFLGRIDNQVKIRGYRIELEEIEAILSQHPDVVQAVVIQREDVPGDKRLVAYIAIDPKSNIRNPKSDLRDFLKAKLPEYMIPSAFAILKSLPLTANGKVDRKSLPAPNIASHELEKSFVAPRNPIEQVLAEIWSQLLGIQRIGIRDNFFDLGGHSLLMTQLVVRVREAFQVDLPLSSLFETPTVGGLAERIEKAIASGETRIIPSPIDFYSEAVLDPTIHPEIPFHWPTTEPKAIFLTGATGFLGTFLLQELLEQTQADIYCLARANNSESAKHKIQNSLESYNLWKGTFSARIIPVLGELSKPLLGLSDEEFKTLASQIDIIYHNGALVNFVYPYLALKPANVLGTQEVLRLASQIKIKPVHYVSTTNAISPARGSGVKVIRENDTIHPDEVMETGYAKSKWVAERLINIARDRGIPVSIYRPGRIVWHSQTGIGNTSDNTYRMLKGCIQMGTVPQRDAMVNLIPVDFVSKAIAHLSRQKDSIGKAFHLVNPHPAHWSQLVNWIRSFGYPLREIPVEEWREKLRTISSENALYPVAANWSKPEDTTVSTPILQFDCQNTFDGLAGTSLVCPPVSAELLNRYISYLIQQGLLKKS